MYFNTFAGNPVACAAGLAVLDVLEEEELIDNARLTGEIVVEGLNALKAKYDLIGDVRGDGLFFAVDLVTDRSEKTPDATAANWIVNDMRQRGVLISRIGQHDNVLKARPPLCFSAEQAEQLLTTLDASLNSLTRQNILER